MLGASPRGGPQSAINVNADIALSLSPLLAVLWRLRRPVPERVLVCCLTRVRLLASGASVAKAVVVAQWAPENPKVDSWAMAVSIATWTVAEQHIAVFGAYSPSLKGTDRARAGTVRHSVVVQDADS